MKCKCVNLTLVGAALLLIQACAGSAPDYSPRASRVAQEAKLARFLDKAEVAERTQTIIAPLCSGAAGTPRSGWGIDDGNWCVVPCGSQGVGESRWYTGSDGHRCLITADTAPATRITTEFAWSDLSLHQPDVFNGFSSSFLRDTEWVCKEYRYRVDPESKAGFWEALRDSEVLYRFYRDGRLFTGSSAADAKPSGSWLAGAEGQVYFNRRQVFKHAIDYGTGRFDDFISAKEKHVCRYVGEADHVAAAE